MGCGTRLLAAQATGTKTPSNHRTHQPTGPTNPPTHRTHQPTGPTNPPNLPTESPSGPVELPRWVCGLDGLVSWVRWCVGWVDASAWLMSPPAVGWQPTGSTNPPDPPTQVGGSDAGGSDGLVVGRTSGPGGLVGRRIMLRLRIITKLGVGGLAGRLGGPNGWTELWSDSWNDLSSDL